jgi:hypothetical protein
LEVDSASIKAVSKPAQVRKKMTEKEKVKGKVKAEKKSGSKRKRTSGSSEVIDIVNDMQRVQAEHTEMLKQLHSIVNFRQQQQQQQMYYYPYQSYETLTFAEAQPAQPVATTKMCSNTFEETHPSNSFSNDEELDIEAQFEAKMKEMIEIYARLNPGCRSNTVRKVMSSLEISSPSDVADFKGAIESNKTDPLVQNELNAFCLDYLQNENC